MKICQVARETTSFVPDGSLESRATTCPGRFRATPRSCRSGCCNYFSCHSAQDRSTSVIPRTSSPSRWPTRSAAITSPVSTTVGRRFWAPSCSPTTPNVPSGSPRLAPRERLRSGGGCLASAKLGPVPMTDGRGWFSTWAHCSTARFGPRSRSRT
jgi:hypothetical protein